MTLQTSGPMSMNDIANEFGTSKPLSMSQLYRGGQYVSSSTITIPTSGLISLNSFYGVSKAFTFNRPITANLSNYNLASILTANGWDGKLMVDVTITVNSGVVVYSDHVSIPAMSIGHFPAGSIIRLINRGHIIGMGGTGGSGSNTGINGQDGGDAIWLNYSTSIENYGIIGGGGGGGAGAKIKLSNAYCGGGGGQSGLQSTIEPLNYAIGESGTFEGPGNSGINKTWKLPDWAGGRGGTWGSRGMEFVQHQNSWERFSLPGEGGKAIDGYSYANIIQYGTMLGRVV